MRINQSIVPIIAIILVHAYLWNTPAFIANQETRTESKIIEIFRLRVTDEGHNTIQGASVHINFFINPADENLSVRIDTTLLTDYNGDIILKLPFYISEIEVEYEIQKIGFCPSTGSTYKSGKSAEMKNWVETIIIHRTIKSTVHFQVKVNGLNGLAQKDVSLSYILFYNNSEFSSGHGTTDSAGLFNVYEQIECIEETDKIKLEVTATKSEYYTQTETLTTSIGKKNKSYLRDAETDKIFKDEISIRIISKRDYFTKSFLSSKHYSKLKNYIISFIDLVVLESLLKDYILNFNSIELKDFKEKKYLTFQFENFVEYNSLKLSKYDIGKIAFDEVIRKILTPLNDNLKSTKEIYGYNLEVLTKTRDFSDENNKSIALLYSFYIPKQTVQSYKNHDISGQQVLDNSIILLDNERIELKLQ